MTKKAKQKNKKKACTKCNKVKPLDEGFYNNCSRPDGKTARCRECIREDNHNYYVRKQKATGGVYCLWQSLLTRCHRGYTGRREYKYYEGKGIAVCDEWRNNFEKFKNWCLANGYRKGLALDRIDNNDDFRPGNCRFTTLHENRNNTG